MAESLASLLRRVEPLPAGKRDSQVALYALALTNVELANAIEELSRGSPYEQRLAGVAACATCNIAWISSAIADPDPYVHRPALHIASVKPALVSDDTVRSALADASAVHRNAILRSIGTRTQLADSIIDSLRADWGDATAGTLLATCSREVVARLLPDLLYAITQWRPLVRRHPDILLDTLRRDLETTAVQTQAWWDRYGDALAALMQRARDKQEIATIVFDLLEKYPARVPPSIAARLHILARADVNRLLKLYTDKTKRYGLYNRPPTNLRRRLARSKAPELEVYLRQQDMWSIAEVLRAAAPRDRPAMFEIALHGREWPDVRIVGGSLNEEILQALPRAYAATLARKAVDILEKAKAPQNEILAAKKYLPPSEVSEELLVATRLPDADDRRWAWEFLIFNAAQAPDSAHLVTTMETMAHRLKNEQNPVRDAALSALRNVPAKRWDVAMLPHLTSVISSTLDARDVSDREQAMILDIALNVLVTHLDSEPHLVFAVTTLDRIVRDCGLAFFNRITLPSSNTQSSPQVILKAPPKGQEAALHAALKPFLDRERAETSKSGYHLHCVLAETLGARADDIPELTADLIAGLQSSNVRVATTVAKIYLSSKTRADRVAYLLENDHSAIAVPEVQRIVSSVRTDLLAFDGVDGFFFDHETPYRSWHFTPLRAHDVRRWTPQQQAAYLEQIERVAGTEAYRAQRSIRARRWNRWSNDGYKPVRLIDILKCVPGGHELARKWADSNVIPVAEEGLAALSSSPDDLPLLLSLAGTDRAKVAMYAASGAARRVEPSVLCDLLRVLLTRGGVKVTSQKEAVRLAASLLPTSLAIGLISPLMSNEKTHRDVLSACVQCTAGRLLDAPAGWDILAAAAASPEATVRLAVLRRSPLAVAPAHRKRCAELICKMASSDDEEVASEALTQLQHWALCAPQAAEILCRQCTDLTRPQKVWTAAARSLSELAGKDTAPLYSTLETLLAELDKSEDDQASAAFLRIHFISSLFTGRAPLTDGTHAVIRLLRTRDETVRFAAMLLFKTRDLSSEDPAATLAVLRDVAALCADRPGLAMQLANSLQERYQFCSPDDVCVPAVLAAATALAEDGGLATGLFAAALLTIVNDRMKWDADDMRRLHRLRKSGIPDVADAARALVPATASSQAHQFSSVWVTGDY